MEEEAEERETGKNIYDDNMTKLLNNYVFNYFTNTNKGYKVTE